MGYTDNMSPELKQRIVQELVPGKQISLAHIIANPDRIMYEKLGLDPSIDYAKSAIGILTVSPAETAIIMGVYRRQIFRYRSGVCGSVQWQPDHHRYSFRSGSFCQCDS